MPLPRGGVHLFLLALDYCAVVISRLTFSDIARWRTATKANGRATSKISPQQIPRRSYQGGRGSAVDGGTASNVAEDRTKVEEAGSNDQEQRRRSHQRAGSISFSDAVLGARR